VIRAEREGAISTKRRLNARSLCMSVLIHPLLILKTLIFVLLAPVVLPLACLITGHALDRCFGPCSIARGGPQDRPFDAPRPQQGRRTARHPNPPIFPGGRIGQGSLPEGCPAAPETGALAMH